MRTLFVSTALCLHVLVTGAEAAPFISSVSPSSAQIGSGALAIVVQGGFADWGSSQLFFAPPGASGFALQIISRTEARIDTILPPSAFATLGSGMLYVQQDAFISPAFTFTITPPAPPRVPEPTTALLLGMGLLGMAGVEYGRRTRQISCVA